MSWLITGGFGQLGIALSKELAKQGLSFDALSSKDLDITNKSIVNDVVSKLSPKVILNCAAWTDVDGAEHQELQASRVNRDGAENVAVAAKRCNAKLIHISTDYVFSGESKSPWQVDGPLSPQSAYGRTKADGEIRVMATYPENSSIVRTAWLYSPWGRNFVKSMIKRALREEGEVPVVNDQIGQPTSATDLAKSIIQLVLLSAPSGIYHGTNSGQASWFEFAQEIFRLAGADVSRIVSVSSSTFGRAAKRPSFSVLSHDAWYQTSVQPMRDWRIAIADTMPAIISTEKARG